jgi:hypothetical protein
MDTRESSSTVIGTIAILGYLALCGIAYYLR